MQSSVVPFREIQQSVFGNRIDAEFYRPDHLASDRVVSKGDYQILSQVTSKIDVGYVGPMASEYVSEGIWLLQTQNVKEFFLNEASKIYIDSEFHDELNKSKVRKGDILIARSGSFGAASIYLEDETINSADIAIIQALPAKVNPYYLVAFLNCKYGVNQLLRFASGGLQGHVNLSILENLKVPALNDDAQNHFTSIIIGSYSHREEAKRLFAQAHNLVLAELGLADWHPTHQRSFITNFSDASKAGRVDADYFQPKYDEVIASIKSYPGGWDTLGNLAVMRKCVEVGQGEYRDDGVPFVRVSNLSPFEISEEKYISEELYALTQQHQPEQGEILLSKDATPGIAHYLREQPKQMIPCSGILRLRNQSTRVNNEYLTLVLNSMLTREQANRDVGGSVILHWRPDQIAGIAVPILSAETQIQIQELVGQSYARRQESKRLLTCAKRAVEVAIEQDERTAIAWLDSEVPLEASQTAS